MHLVVLSLSFSLIQNPFPSFFFSYLPLHDIGILKNSGQLFWLTSSNVSKTLTLCTYTGLWGE